MANEMTICKQCVHYLVCMHYSPERKECKQFKDSTNFVEVVHGRWIDNIDENGYLCNAWRKCSACGGLNYSKRPPYCPNCGAKMDGGNEDG